MAASDPLQSVAGRRDDLKCRFSSVHCNDWLCGASVLRVLFILSAMLAPMVPLVASGQIASAGSPVDDFVKDVLEIHTRIVTCRKEFDPHEALLKYDYATGSMRKHEEPDQREPGVTNHVMTWRFPGISLTSTTHFSFYGPSTWLRRLELSEPSTLVRGLKFGDPVQKFAETLAISEVSIRSNRVHVDRADVTFVVGADDAVNSIVFECIAD